MRLSRTGFSFALSIGILACLFALQGCEPASEGSDDAHLVFGAKNLACGNWFAYSQDTSGYFVLFIGHAEDGASPKDDTLSLASQDSASPLLARIYRLNQANKVGTRFCNDVLYPELKITDSLTVTQATVEVHKEAPASDVFGAPYRMKLRLHDLRYRDLEGIEHALPELHLDSLLAGWLAG